MEDSQLIERCIRGERKAWKKLYELHAPTMMSICQRYVRSRETARDLLQDGFVKLFAKIHAYSGTGSFNGWMRQIFVTTSIDYLRRNDNLRYSVDIEKCDYLMTDQDISIYEHLSANEIFACIVKLPDIYRTVFNMHAIEGYTHVEIAEELEISDSTSRSRYAKARELLQNMLANDNKSS
jgi:RNA polymerase sigma-70 factor (ECF subfamily)